MRTLDFWTRSKKKLEENKRSRQNDVLRRTTSNLLSILPSVLSACLLDPKRFSFTDAKLANIKFIDAFSVYKPDIKLAYLFVLPCRGPDTFRRKYRKINARYFRSAKVRPRRWGRERFVYRLFVYCLRTVIKIPWYRVSNIFVVSKVNVYLLYMYI